MRKLFLIVSILVTQYCFAQPAVIINTEIDYKASIKVNASNELKNLKLLLPNIVLDLKYATTNNFTKQKLYNNATTTYMRVQPATALQLLQKELNKMGYGIKVFDAYRPYAATKLMWDLIHDEAYVANPKNGSGHNRGTTIDLTLVDIKSGRDLDMGTPFDNFTDSASHAFTPKFNATIIANRTLLKTSMEKYGFKILASEWWHYGWVTTFNYDVMDLSFKQLSKLIK
jgi:zinc D-Ala-D-Ala dipeptidase